MGFIPLPKSMLCNKNIYLANIGDIYIGLYIVFGVVLLLLVADLSGPNPAPPKCFDIYIYIYINNNNNNNKPPQER